MGGEDDGTACRTIFAFSSANGAAAPGHIRSALAGEVGGTGQRGARQSARRRWLEADLAGRSGTGTCPLEARTAGDAERHAQADRIRPAPGLPARGLAPL